MKLDSKSLVLNLLGADANIQVNKKVLLTLGLEEAFFLSYLIDQYKYFEREGLLREDGSFYSSNMDIALYTTLNNSQIARVKKAGMDKDLFKVSLEESRTKSYYYLNFDKILEIIGTEKTNFELAYDSKFDSEKININIETLEDVENLRKLTFNELRFLCKQNKVRYTGNDKKENLVSKILKIKNPSIFATTYFSTVNDITLTSEQEKRSLRENGQSSNSVSEISLTVSAKSITNQEQINQEQISCHERDLEIENLFHQLEINYTDSNVELTKNILLQLEGNKELLKEYIITKYNQLKKISNIKNLPALFSSKLKNIDMELITKLLLKDKNEKNLKIEEEEKIKIEKDREEMIRKSEEVIEKLNTLTLEKKNRIINEAEKLYLEKNGISVESIEQTKKYAPFAYLRMISSNIKEIFDKEMITWNFLYI